MSERMEITLKAARVNVGLTLEEACKILRISRATLAKYEKGTSYPSWDMLARMAELYRIDWRDFSLHQC